MSPSPIQLIRCCSFACLRACLACPAVHCRLCQHARPQLLHPRGRQAAGGWAGGRVAPGVVAQGWLGRGMGELLPVSLPVWCTATAGLCATSVVKLSSFVDTAHPLPRQLHRCAAGQADRWAHHPRHRHHHRHGHRCACLLRRPAPALPACGRLPDALLCGAFLSPRGGQQPVCFIG